MVLEKKQGHNRNISKLMNFNFRNITTFRTSQNGIKDNQIRTEVAYDKEKGKGDNEH